MMELIGLLILPVIDYAERIIHCTAIDSKGIKWFVEHREIGVFQFDGTTWTTYNTSNSGLASDTVYSITVDNQNNKWIAEPAGDYIRT